MNDYAILKLWTSSNDIDNLVATHIQYSHNAIDSDNIIIFLEMYKEVLYDVSISLVKFTKGKPFHTYDKLST
jgi:hypothetical protein